MQRQSVGAFAKAKVPKAKQKRKSSKRGSKAHAVADAACGTGKKKQGFECNSREAMLYCTQALLFASVVTWAGCSSVP